MGDTAIFRSAFIYSGDGGGIDSSSFINPIYLHGLYRGRPLERR